jgi:hypothetical protein
VSRRGARTLEQEWPRSCLFVQQTDQSVSAFSATYGVNQGRSGHQAGPILSSRRRHNHHPGYPGAMAEVRPIMTGDEWAAGVVARPPTADDVTITLDGRRIDSKEKAIAWLAEIEADRAAGKTAADSLA